MPNNEWKDITDPEELFKLKREEWEIEYFDSFHTYWIIWNRVTWNEKRKFRARPRQPKMKKVKLLAFLGNFVLHFVREDSDMLGLYGNDKNYTRQPHLDLEGEVPE